MPYIALQVRHLGGEGLKGGKAGKIYEDIPLTSQGAFARRLRVAYADHTVFNKGKCGHVLIQRAHRP